MSERAGKFIVMEGPEGSGKSAQMDRLVDHLQAEGISLVRVREPGGTPTGEEIRKILLHGAELTLRSEALLMISSRAILTETVIRPALEEGQWVVADRFDTSTFAYQGYGRGLPLADLETLNAFAVNGLVPDLTLVLDVPIEVADARRRQRGNPDRIEAASAAFHRRVVEGYRALVAANPRLTPIWGVGDPEHVHAAVWSEVRRLLPARRRSRVS